MKMNLQTNNGGPAESAYIRQNPPDLRRLRLDFLARIQVANKSGKEKEDHLVPILLGHYPTGMLPAWGVTMCLIYLCEEHRDKCVKNDVLLQMIDVGLSDKGWSMNDVPQGGIKELIGWITGFSSAELRNEEIRATTWYVRARALIREELVRRAA